MYQTSWGMFKSWSCPMFFTVFFSPLREQKRMWVHVYNCLAPKRSRAWVKNVGLHRITTFLSTSYSCDSVVAKPFLDVFFQIPKEFRFTPTKNEEIYHDIPNQVNNCHGKEKRSCNAGQGRICNWANLRIPRPWFASFSWRTNIYCYGLITFNWLVVWSQFKNLNVIF